MCMYVLYTCVSLSLSLSLYIYIEREIVCVCVCVCCLSYASKGGRASSAWVLSPLSQRMRA